MFCCIYLQDNDLKIFFLQNRFFVLKTGLRVIDMNEAGRLAICCVILHNLAIKHGDLDMDGPEPQMPSQQLPTPPAPGFDMGREGRRNQLLQSFV